MIYDQCFRLQRSVDSTHLKCQGPDVLSPSHPSPTRPLILQCVTELVVDRLVDSASFANSESQSRFAAALGNRPNNHVLLLATTMPNQRRTNSRAVFLYFSRFEHFKESETPHRLDDTVCPGL
jgi:hypothetical protein